MTGNRSVRLFLRNSEVRSLNRLLRLAEMGLVGMEAGDINLASRVMHEGRFYGDELILDITLTEKFDSAWETYLAWYLQKLCERCSVLN